MNWDYRIFNYNKIGIEEYTNSIINYFEIMKSIEFYYLYNFMKSILGKYYKYPIFFFGFTSNFIQSRFYFFLIPLKYLIPFLVFILFLFLFFFIVRKFFWFFVNVCRYFIEYLWFKLLYFRNFPNRQFKGATRAFNLTMLLFYFVRKIRKVESVWGDICLIKKD
jgi:hypothetical protein